MVKLRLKRLGRKRRPFYRIVAMTDNQPRSGQALAELGTYDPIHARFDVDEEAAISWLNHGAQMTPTVRDLFHSKGVLARWQGHEGRLREDALKRHKPRRHKKLAAAPAPVASEEAPEGTGATDPAAATSPAEAASSPAQASGQDSQAT